MSSFALKVWCGPALVKPIAEKMRAAGVHISFVGTEHLYCHGEGSCIDAARHNVLADLMRMFGTDFGLRPRKV